MLKIKKEITNGEEEMKFELETFATLGQVRHQIKKCEGKHVQQIAYSSYHDSLTQVCFDCKKIRTNIAFLIKEELKSKEEKNK